MSRYNRFTKYTAIFDPVKKDDLQHDAPKYIGKRVTVEYDGVREMGQYSGKESFMVVPENGDRYVGWAPIDDFKDIKVIVGG